MFSAKKTESKTARQNAAAFTLVELLVVIGIIAVLIGILLPSLARARESANSVKCMANLRSMGNAITMYVGENKGMLPIGFVVKNNTIDGGVTYLGETTDWTVLLMNVLNKKLGTDYTSQQTSGTGHIGTRSIFGCPSVSIDPSVKTYFTHYSSHPRLIPDLATADFYRGAGLKRLRTYKIARVKRTSEIAAIFDATVNNPSGPGQFISFAVAFALDNARITRKTYLTDDYSIDATINGNQPIDLKPAGGAANAAFVNQDGDKNQGNIRFRHLKDTSANVLMMDGHVQAFQFKKATGQTDLLRKNFNVAP